MLWCIEKNILIIQLELSNDEIMAALIFSLKPLLYLIIYVFVL